MRRVCLRRASQEACAHAIAELREGLQEAGDQEQLAGPGRSGAAVPVRQPRQQSGQPLAGFPGQHTVDEVRVRVPIKGFALF